MKVTTKSSRLAWLAVGSLWLGLLVLSCAGSGPAFELVAHDHSDKGVVYVYRSSSLAGTAIKPTISINGEVICELPSGGYIAKIVPAGTVTVSARTESSEEVFLALPPGEDGFVKLGLQMGIAAGRPTLAVKSPEVANREITPCQQVCGD